MDQVKKDWVLGLLRYPMAEAVTVHAPHPQEDFPFQACREA
jgi:hypothetical protein